MSDQGNLIGFIYAEQYAERVHYQQLFSENLREEKGVTQYEMSEDICAWETVSRIESGRTPNQKKLYRLWKNLGLSVRDTTDS